MGGRTLRPITPRQAIEGIAVVMVVSVKSRLRLMR